MIDTLFLTAAAGGVIFAAVCAAVEEESLAPRPSVDDAPEPPREDE